MKVHEAFLLGIKPAYLCSHRYEADALKILLNLNYPNMLHYELEDFDVPGEIFDRGTLFFQNELQKELYLQESKGIESHSKEGIMLMGKILGFPPVASEFFAIASDDEYLNSKRAGFSYYGIQFAGNIDDVNIIAEWLWSNIKAPVTPVEVSYRKEKIMIEPSVVTT